MNLLLFESDEMTDDNLVLLHGRRSAHIIKILGCNPGDTIRAGMLNGAVGIGEILSISGKGNDAKVMLRFTSGDVLPQEPPVDLIMALVRPIMLKRILTQVASLGVGRIFLINANRVEKSFFGASLLQDRNYEPFLLQGLEQARDTLLPQVTVHERFRPFIEDFVPTIAQTYTRLLVAHPDAASDLQQSFGNVSGGRTLLAVGPEGGWVDFEVEKFIAHSFIPVGLGSRILRADTAVVALLSQLMLLRGKGTGACRKL